MPHFGTQIPGSFLPPCRDDTLHAIAKALLRIRSHGVNQSELAKLLDCSTDALSDATNEKTLLGFDKLARLAHYFPDEWRLVECLWTAGASRKPTAADRFERIERELDALRREVAA